MPDHTGICSFCGSAVRQRFTVCPSCGAVWTKVQTGLGGAVFGLAKVPIAVGLIGGGGWFLFTHSLMGLGLAGGSLAISTFVFGSAKAWRWVRRQP